MAPREDCLPWPALAATILSDALGVGALALPGALVRLGWLPGLAVFAAVTAAAAASALMYGRLVRRCGDAATMDELGSAAMGPHGVKLVFATCYSTLILVPVIMHVTSVEALGQMLAVVGWQVPRIWQVVAVAVAVLPLAQYRRITDLEWATALGTGGMIGALLLALAKLLAIDPPPKHAPRTSLVGHAGFLPAAVSAMDVVFSFAGQCNWPRFALANRREFHKAAGVSVAVLAASMAAVGATGYACLGQSMDASQPLTSVLQGDAWAVAMNAGVVVHCLIAYVVNLNVFAFVLLGLLAPARNAPHHKLHHTRWHARHSRRASGAAGAEARQPLLRPAQAPAGEDADGGLEAGSSPAPPPQQQKQPDWALWGATTAAAVAVAAAAAFAFPRFNEIMGILASVADVSAMVTLPALFTLRGLRPQSAGAVWALRGLAVLGVCVSVLGVGASVAALVVGAK